MMREIDIRHINKVYGEVSGFAGHLVAYRRRGAFRADRAGRGGQDVAVQDTDNPAAGG